MGKRDLLEDGTRQLSAILSQGKVGSKTATPDDIQTIISAILTTLKSDDKLEDVDTDTAKDLAHTLAGVMAPVVMLIDQPRDENEVHDENASLQSRVTQRCLKVGPTALQALEELFLKTGTNSAGDDVLLSLATSTESSRDWALTGETAERIPALINRILSESNTSKEQFMVENILQRYLRPLFSKSKPASVTESGRKAEYTDPVAGRGGGLPDDSAETKPWKFIDFRAIPLVAWAVDEADEALIGKRWPLFLPVLLTLVDDSATDVRRRGLIILTRFLDKIPSKTLHGAGLARVFEDAITPTLNFLPSLTPEDESVRLLGPAFGALRCLAGKQPGPNSPYRNKLLDRVLREGVFHGYFYAREHVRIVEVLCQQMVGILDDMGIHSVKHLKDIIPMLSAILADPFATSTPQTLRPAIDALHAVLRNSWPRIPNTPWQDEILQAVILCWLNLAEQPGGQLDDLRGKLVGCVKALGAVLQAWDIRLGEVAAPLVEREPGLGELFLQLS